MLIATRTMYGARDSEGCLAPPDGLAVHDPVLAPDVRIHEREPVGLLQVMAELGSEEDRQGGDVDQEVLAGRPPGALGRESPSGHEIMHVRMVAQVAGPGTGARPPSRSGRR